MDVVIIPSIIKNNLMENNDSFNIILTYVNENVIQILEKKIIYWWSEGNKNNVWKFWNILLQLFNLLK